MKVGILTFQNANNYGAELQAFALCTTVRKMGYDAELVNYENPSVTDYETPRLPYVPELVKNPVSFAFRLTTAKSFSARKATFDSFNKKYELIGSLVKTQVEIEDKYDVVIVGSDQVWNSVITCGDMTYFLSRINSSKTRKLAYAASFGYESFSADLAEQGREALRDFSQIGVRELEGKSLVEALSGVDSSVVLDPTLLFRKADWEKVISLGEIRNRVLEIANHKQGYLFVYIAAERSRTIAFAKRVAKRANLRLVVVSGYRGFPFIGCGEDVSFVSVEEFLFLIQNASLVVTSSFHGYALALALEKEVYFSLAKGRRTKNSRLISLAKITNTEDRVVPEYMPMCSMGSCLVGRCADEDHKASTVIEGYGLHPMDYSSVRERIEVERQRSLAFLRDGLGECATACGYESRGCRHERKSAAW